MKKILLSALALLMLHGSGSAQNLPSYVPANGLVGWWPFNGNANDESGNGNNGTVNGATLTADRFGNAGSAYQFDSNSFISGSASEFPSGNQPRTVSAWYKANGLGANQGGICGKQFLGYGGGPCGRSFNFFFENCDIGPENIGKLEIQGHCQAFRTFTSYPNPANDVWHQITLVYSDSSFSFYNNGVKVLTSAGGILPNTNVINKIFSFGKIPNESGESAYDSPIYRGFTGSIDDIAIWNRALTQQEITALYQGGNTTTNCLDLPSNLQQGLVGYWPFCGNANDESGNNNHGTVNGATLTTDRFGNAEKAYSFDGVDDEIACPNTFFNTASPSYTISLWAKSISAGNSNNQNDAQVLLNSQPHRGLGLVYYGTENPFSSSIDKKLSVLAGDGSDWNAISTDSLYSAQDFPLNNWNLVTLVKNNSKYKLFINNIPEDSFMVSGNLPSVQSAMIFGNIASGFDREGFLGSLDDIAIWNRALNQEEITQLYNQGICKTSITVTDTLLIHTGITSYNPVAYQNTLKVWPNPGNQDITLDAGNLASMQGWKIKISNSLGQEVYPATLISQQQQVLDLSNWGGNGLYLLHLINPQGHITEVKKIILAP